ncbi:hypothetical protein HHI36_016956 [Cryptolaemus montrouzieri]|uniref:DUF8207 domain-containing protein n=1 Tax=Cryptolaemus montrouzieri TaxID=559131 RepID=A0ABD2NLH0_9CUCU
MNEDDDDDNRSLEDERSQQELYEKLQDSAALDQYFEQYPHNVKKYIHLFRMKTENIDEIFGPKYDPTLSKWTLGCKQMELGKKSGDIITENQNFNGTPGLYELKFTKQPQK